MRKGMQKMLEAKDISFAYSEDVCSMMAFRFKSRPANESLCARLRVSEKRRYAVFLLVI